LTSYFSKARSGALALVLALAVAVAALVSGGSPARADTAPNSISHVWINLQDSPSASMQSQYRTFLQSKRRKPESAGQRQHRPGGTFP
jgi:hypothetical protein